MVSTSSVIIANELFGSINKFQKNKLELAPQDILRNF